MEDVVRHLSLSKMDRLLLIPLVVLVLAFAALAGYPFAQAILLYLVGMFAGFALGHRATALRGRHQAAIAFVLILAWFVVAIAVSTMAVAGYLPLRPFGYDSLAGNLAQGLFFGFGYMLVQQWFRSSAGSSDRRG
jgi:hypothetical protein